MIARKEGLTVGEFEESVALQMAIEGDGEEGDGGGDDSLVIVPSTSSPALEVEVRGHERRVNRQAQQVRRS